MAGDHRMAAHPTTGFQDNQAREILETPRLEPGPHTGDLFIDFEIRGTGSIHIRIGLQHSRAAANELTDPEQPRNAMLHRVASRATLRTGATPP